MPTRSARTVWTGALQQGGGHAQLVSSELGRYELSFRDRVCEHATVTTTPEELLAAAYSASFAMQLSAVVAEQGGTPQSADVTAQVTLGPDEVGGFRLTTITLAVHGRVEGFTSEQFEEAAQLAQRSCPVSRALSGVGIMLNATLEN